MELIFFCDLESISLAYVDKAEQTQHRTFWLELKPLTGLLFYVYLSISFHVLSGSDA